MKTSLLKKLTDNKKQVASIMVNIDSALCADLKFELKRRGIKINSFVEIAAKQFILESKAAK